MLATKHFFFGQEDGGGHDRFHDPTKLKLPNSGKKLLKSEEGRCLTK